MQDQVVRLSESSYGKGFVIFQVVLPLILHISYYVNYANCGNTNWQHREFLFLSARPWIAQNFFHIIIVSGPNFITVIISIWFYTYQDPFSASEVTQFLPFPKRVKCLCSKEPPNHTNKAQLQVTPIDRK